YALSRAKLVSDNWVDDGLDGEGAGKFLLLKDLGKFEIIDTKTRDAYRDNYKSLNVQSFTCNVGKKRIDSLINHPVCCYHRGKAVYYFYENNFLSGGGAVNGHQLMFSHGGILLDIGTTERYWVQTPIVHCIDSKMQSRVDNEINPSFPYLNKMLDL